MGTHDAVNWPLFIWLQMPGFTVAFSLRMDGVAWMLVALTIVVMLLVLTNWPRRTPQGWFWLAVVGITMAIVAGDLGQLFVGWTLSAWASSEMARSVGAKKSAFRPVWLVQRISDMALLCGFGLVWMHFGSSLEFSAWTPEAIRAQRPELIESIALCVLFGVIGRCAQLPLTVWLETETGFASQSGNSMKKLSDQMVGFWNVPDGHHVAMRLKADPSTRWHSSEASHISPTTLAWWLCAAFFPVGIGVVLRFEPFFASASHSRLLMVVVGAFTLVMCSASAVAQNNWSRVLAQIAVGQCGLMLIALGLGDPNARTSGLMMFHWQCVALAVLLVTSQRNAGSTAITVFSLSSGLWGRHSLMNLVWERSWAESRLAETESIVLGATESSVWPLIAVLMSLAELLTSLALLRAWFYGRRERTHNQPSSSVAHWTIVLTVGVLLVGGVASDLDSVKTGRPMLIGVSPLLPLSAIGMVLAWWMYSKPSSLPDKVSAAMGPFARLSRNRFYWDDLYYLLVVHPAKVVSEWLVWFDVRAFGSAADRHRNRFAKWIEDSIEPLQLGSPMIGALTMVSSVAVLTWTLLWLRS